MYVYITHIHVYMYMYMYIYMYMWGNLVLVVSLFWESKGNGRRGKH